MRTRRSRRTSSTRHHRQRGDETFFLTGVDEHADKVARVAAEEGLEPKEYADRIVGAWQELPRRLNAINDFFIRTSDEGHKRFVQDFLQRIYDNGDVYQDVYAGWYCVGCEAFKTEAELVDGKCPDHGTAAEWLEEKNWFFRLSAYQDKLLAALRRASGLRPAGLPLQRGAQLHRRRAARLLDQPRHADVGRPDSVGSRAGRLRLGRRARQLPQRAELRAGREPRALLAGGASAREGHPSLPLRLLAGAAAVGGRGAAEAAVRPRVPQLRQPQDVEVARQRHQPARADRRLRRRRGPLLRRARRRTSAGTATSRWTTSASATNASSGTTSATSCRARPR